MEGVFDTLHAGTDIPAGCTLVWIALSFAGGSACPQWAQPAATDGVGGRGSYGLPAGDCFVQEFEFGGGQVTGAVGVALGLDPHPEGVFPVRVGRPGLRLGRVS